MASPVTGRAGFRYHSFEELELRLPFWRYGAAIKDQPCSFLLDSARDPENLGKYSFIGGDPFLVYRAKRQPGRPPSAGASVEIIRNHGPDYGPPEGLPDVTRHIADGFEELRRLLCEFRVEPDEYRDHPVPFLSGAVGYFGYEAGYFIEALSDAGADDLGLPDICFLFIDSVMAHCNLTGRSYLSVIGRGADENASHRNALRIRSEWLERIRKFEADPDSEWKPAAGDVKPFEVDIHAHFDEKRYAEAVGTVKEHIFAGDAYEVCLTHRLESSFKGEPWNLYRELRRINPAPFAAFLRLPEVQVISSSPERFLRLGRDRIAESRPIKGTRPRGQSREHDERLYRELFSSIKDRAENVMIVDLVRNDFGKISKFGTVHVPELMTIERYATVFQMVSTVRGELDAGCDVIDLIKACFPGGSMTGAPKIEAMNIIDRIEPVKRGIYSGSIGYIDFSGNADLNIVIRTIVVKGDRCYFNVGGAIVADSDPLDEYTETMDKARALIAALTNMGE
jgi:aminodeoxychorismate synthase component I